MENTLTVLLANLVIDASIAREESYDWTASLADIEDTQRRKAEARRARPDDKYADTYICSNASSLYKLSTYNAAANVCASTDVRLAQAVYLLLDGSWNDAIEWAKEVTGREIPVSEARVKWEADMDAIFDKYSG